jgi:hypothetical protein
VSAIRLICGGLGLYTSAVIFSSLPQRGRRIFRVTWRTITRTCRLLWTGTATGSAGSISKSDPVVRSGYRVSAMSQLVDTDELNERRAHYYMDQQVGIYSIVLSIALGVAGFAAASIIHVPRADRPYHALLWVLWLTSLVAVAIVYSGMNANVYALPNRTPDLFDMLLPFAMALMEFILFAVLTSPLPKQASPRVIVAVWFASFGLFGCVACTVILRVRWLFQHALYDSALQESVNHVIKKMYEDFRGAGSGALTGIAAATILEWVHAVPLDIAYIPAAFIIVGFFMGFRSHMEQRSVLEHVLAKAREDNHSYPKSS